MAAGPERHGVESHDVETNGALRQVDGVTLQHKAPQTRWGMQYQSGTFSWVVRVVACRFRVAQTDAV
jgi:hypothetical protein